MATSSPHSISRSIERSASAGALMVDLWTKVVRGQVKSDAQWISEHYDAGADFYLAFLDKQARCYSHGYFSSDYESLEAAMQTKLNTAIESCGIQSGWRVLDIGAGWGAFTEHAGQLGVHVTSLTISKESHEYVNDLIERESLPCRVLREHFLEHKTDEPYDAIVNLGVTEHLPDYTATLQQYERLLKPGGRVFLDACASRTKYPFSTFGHATSGPVTHPAGVGGIPGGGREDSLRSGLGGERPSQLPADDPALGAESRPRARRGDAHASVSVLYRRFRLYLWGCVHQFTTGETTAYRMLLQLADGSAHRKTGRI